MAAGVAPKSAANWVTGEFSRLLNQHAADGLRASDVALTPEGLAELIGEVEAGRVSGANAKHVLAHCLRQRRVAAGRDRARGAGAGRRLRTRSNGKWRRCLPSSRSRSAQYRAGKQQLYGFLVGQVMKRTAGRADARLVNGELRRRLDG